MGRWTQARSAWTPNGAAAGRRVNRGSVAGGVRGRTSVSCIAKCPRWPCAGSTSSRPMAPRAAGRVSSPLAIRRPRSGRPTSNSTCRKLGHLPRRPTLRWNSTQALVLAIFPSGCSRRGRWLGAGAQRRAVAAGGGEAGGVDAREEGAAGGDAAGCGWALREYEGSRHVPAAGGKPGAVACYSPLERRMQRQEVRQAVTMRCERTKNSRYARPRIVARGRLRIGRNRRSGVLRFLAQR